MHPFYAMMLVTGEKTVEIRTWSTEYRGDILICSTQKKLHGFISGHAMGIVELVDIVPMKKEHVEPALLEPIDYNPSSFAWLLKNPRIIKPIPLKGKLSLWNYDGDVEVIPAPKNDEEDQKLFDMYWKDLIF